MNRYIYIYIHIIHIYIYIYVCAYAIIKYVGKCKSLGSEWLARKSAKVLPGSMQLYICIFHWYQLLVPAVVYRLYSPYLDNYGTKKIRKTFFWWDLCIFWTIISLFGCHIAQLDSRRQPDWNSFGNHHPISSESQIMMRARSKVLAMSVSEMNIGYPPQLYWALYCISWVTMTCRRKATSNESIRLTTLDLICLFFMYYQSQS